MTGVNAGAGVEPIDEAEAAARMAEHAGQPVVPPEELQQAVGESPRPAAPMESPRHPPLTPVAPAGGVGVPTGATPVSSRPPAAGEDTGDVVSLDPSTIKIDAARFQFKSGGDAQGVNQQLTGVKEWDNTANGVALVWEDLKGDRYVVDGHQRLALAQRLKAQGQTPRIRAIILREKDGVTAEDAMQTGSRRSSGRRWRRSPARCAGAK